MSTRIWYALEVPLADHSVRKYTGSVIFETEGIYIADIRKEVKKLSQNLLRHIDTPWLQVFNGKHHMDEELYVQTIWNLEVHGGGTSDPLIIRAPLPVPSSNNEGKCFWCFVFKVQLRGTL